MVLNGTSLVIFVDGVQVGCLQENQISINVDLPDATCKDSGGYANHIKGLKDWQVSGSGLYDPDNSDFTADDIVDKILNGTSVVVAFTTNETGSIVYKGSADFQNLSISAPMEAASGFDFSLKGNGPLLVSVAPQIT
jgi:predicted secreted protein